MNRETFRRELLSRAMLSKGWRQQEIAGAVKCSTGNLTSFLAGRNNSIDLALKLCQAVGLDIRLAYETCGLPIPEPATTPEGHANAA